jgi:hypothetical protein
MRNVFVTMFQIRLREIGKAEEVLRASFRELNSNMNSWNREFFEGLRYVLKIPNPQPPCARGITFLQLLAAAAA